MSYVALVTERFDEAQAFYGTRLGFPVVAQWDRVRGRGVRFNLGGGLRLELLDAHREPRKPTLHASGERVHVVIEVEDADAAWMRLSDIAPKPETVSWGARLFRVEDPDGICISYLQWLPCAERDPKETTRGDMA